MRARRLALVPLACLALTAAPGLAAPTTTPQVVDPAGDAVGGQPGTDVVSVLYTTAGRGAGKAYVPRQLVVTLTLAGPVVEDPGLTYEVEAVTDTCGEVTFTVEPGTVYGQALGLNGWADWGDCTVGDDSSVELLTAKIQDRTVTWTFGIKATPLRIGTVFRDFRVRVDPSNPVVPFPSSATGTELGLIDAATGKGSWKLS